MSAIAAQQTRKLTREERVLELLRARGTAGACVGDVPNAVGYTLRNAVAILRQRGEPIVAVRCTVHPHEHPIRRYSLSGVATQLELET